MKDLTYCNFPQIPEAVLLPIDQLLVTQGLEYRYGKDKPGLTAIQVNPELAQWIKENIPFPVYSQYQVIRSSLPIHRDTSIIGWPPRRLAINYLLETGGPNVVTSTYHDDRTLAQECVFGLHHWHCIKALKLHGVTNLPDGAVRIAISLVPVDQEKYIQENFPEGY